VNIEVLFEAVTMKTMSTSPQLTAKLTLFELSSTYDTDGSRRVHLIQYIRKLKRSVREAVTTFKISKSGVTARIPRKRSTLKGFVSFFYCGNEVRMEVLGLGTNCDGGI
jgi:hypothetical protein